MKNLIDKARQFQRQRLLAAVAGIAAALSIGAVISPLALGGHAGPRPKVTFSVLKHHRVRAVKATATSNGLIRVGTAVARTESNGVTTEIFIAELASGEVCLTELQVGKGGATACGRPAEVQQNGVDVGLTAGENGAPSGTAILVPDGVASATVSDTNGSTHTQTVTNNILVVTDPNLASVSYVAPSGATKTLGVPSA